MNMRIARIMNDNVAKFRKMGTSVERVISNLDKHQDKIESITAIITWKSGDTDVCHNEKSTGDMSYEALLFQAHVMSMIHGE